MRRKLFAVAAVGTAGLLALTACGGSSSGGDTTAATTGGAAATTDAASGAGGTVGVILPDSVSSPRWESSDRPFLEKAFSDAGLKSDIQNAGGDVSKFQSIADGMITEKVKVLMIVNLDNDSGSAVIKKATAAGIPVIDYDRLTLGGGSSYYVSFDNVAVGTAIGEGLVKCMQANGDKTGNVVELNGSPTDNNATLFKQGYDKVIRTAGYKVAKDQAVPDWDAVKGAQLFTQIDTTLKGNYVGVAAANDTLGGAVVARLKSTGKAGKIPVTGQDASVEGLQRVLTGEQCVTIYKSAKLEAGAASKLAIDIIKGDKASADALAKDSSDDTTLKTKVPSVLLTPEQITPENVEDVVKDGGQTAAAICTTPAIKKACTKYGVS
jgi:D-xylose transport system substrate-binding protein